MKLTKTQKNRIIKQAHKLFMEETGRWVKKESIGKVGISPSGALQWKNILTWGVMKEEWQLKLRLEKYLSETLGLDVYCCVLLTKNHEDDGGIDLTITIEDWDKKELLHHDTKVIEFKDREVHKVLD
jgi:hypothetical protein